MTNNISQIVKRGNSIVITLWVKVPLPQYLIEKHKKKVKISW